MSSRFQYFKYLETTTLSATTTAEKEEKILRQLQESVAKKLDFFKRAVAANEQEETEGEETEGEETKGEETETETETDETENKNKKRPRLTANDDFDEQLKNISSTDKWMSPPSSPLSLLSKPSTPQILYDDFELDWFTADEECVTDTSTSSLGRAKVARTCAARFPNKAAAKAAAEDAKATKATNFFAEFMAWYKAEQISCFAHYKEFFKIKPISSCGRREYKKYGFTYKQYLQYLDVLLYIDYMVKYDVGNNDYYKKMKLHFMSILATL